MTVVNGGKDDGVNSYWSLDLAGGSGYTYDLGLNYTDALMGTASEPFLKPARKLPSATAIWDMYNPSATNAGNNSLSYSNLNAAADFTAMEQTTVSLCPGGDGMISSAFTGTTYQWQLDNGSGYTNISDNTNYSGTNTGTLQLNDIPSSWYGYKYRVIIDGINGNGVSLQSQVYWTGAANSSFENPLNWNCGVLPDSNTNVVINTGSVIINSNKTIRSLKLKPGVVITVSPGFNLTLIR